MESRTSRNKRRAGGSDRTATVAMVKMMLRNHDVASRELRLSTTTGSGTASASGTVWAITQGIIQGDNIEQREGAQINVKHLTVQLQATMNSAAEGTQLRVIVFRDLESHGTVPAVTDVLDTASTMSGYNVYWRQSRRFKIMVDQLIPMSISGNSRHISRRWDFKQNMVKVTYLGNTDVAGANGPNSYYLLVIDDLGANHPTYGFGWTVTYFDS